MCTYIWTLYSSQKHLNYFFWQIDFFYLSDYDYEMLLAAGIGGWELCER